MATERSRQDTERMEALATLDRVFDEQAADRRALWRLQQRVWKRERRIAALSDRAGGTTLLGRHYGAEPALPYANPAALR